jgi:hypothetical protein
MIPGDSITTNFQEAIILTYTITNSQYIVVCSQNRLISKSEDCHPLPPHHKPIPPHLTAQIH